MMFRRKDQRQVTQGGLKEATIEMSSLCLQNPKTNSEHTAEGSCLKFEAQGSGVAIASEIRVLT